MHLPSPPLLHRPTSHLLHIFTEIVQRWEIPRLDTLWTNEDPAFRLTREVPLACYGAVILARWLVKRDADPGSEATWDFRDSADVTYGTAAGVGVGVQAAAGVEG